MNMMCEVTQKVKNLFSNERLDILAKKTKFIQRKKKITANDFLSHHLCSELRKENSIAEIATEFLESSDITVSKQAIHKKYTARGVDFMRHVLEELMNFTAQPQPLLKTLPSIRNIKITDSSYFKLHEGLAALFPGLRNQKAGIKLQTILDGVTHRLYALDIRSAKENDQSYKCFIDYIEPHDLSINDLGYFCVESFKTIQEKNAFFLSRLLKATAIYSTVKKKRIDLEKVLKKTKKNCIEKTILLGEAAKFPCRIVAVRLPPEAYQQRLKNLVEKNRKNGHHQKSSLSIFDEWTVFVTNLAPCVTADTLLTLYSLRWQIELFFKMLKTFLNLRDTTTYQNPHKALIAIYSSLIAAVLLTYCSLTIDKQDISLFKAARTFVKHIRHFVSLIRNNKPSIEWMRNKLVITAGKEFTLKRPTTKQLLGVNYA